MQTHLLPYEQNATVQTHLPACPGQVNIFDGQANVINMDLYQEYSPTVVIWPCLDWHPKATHPSKWFGWICELYFKHSNFS